MNHRGAQIARSAREARKLAAQAKQAAGGRGARAKLRAAAKFEELAGRCEKVASQIARQAGGLKITDRLVSIAAPNARPIRKGKRDKPTESRYVAQIAEVAPKTGRVRAAVHHPAGQPGREHDAVRHHERALPARVSPRLVGDGGFHPGPTNEALPPGPLIVGGMGRSGSRPLLQLLMQLRWFMAPPRNNPEEDALDVAIFDYRWTPPFVNGQADLEQMRREFDEDVLPKLLPGGRWGWAHNASAHLLPFYLERFPDMRFIHIIRDGRDVAVGRQGRKSHTMRLGRALLDADPTPVTPDHPAWKGKAPTVTGGVEGTPERVAAFWAKMNREIADFSEQMLGDRYLRLRLEDLGAEPQTGVRQIARFLGTDDPPPQAAKLFARRPTIGRWQAQAPPGNAEVMSVELSRFGYVRRPADEERDEQPGKRHGTQSDLYLDLLRQAVAGLLARQWRTAKPREDGGVDIVEGSSGFGSWPADAETMVGSKRLDNVRHCAEDVLARGVPGDLIETGVWRGGSTIFMRGILAAHGVSDRRVWVADSFQGLPPPDASVYPADEGDRLHEQDFLAASEEEVRESFRRFDLLDDQVEFLPGWFRDTLPTLTDQRFAVVRLDRDMYESTMIGLESPFAVTLKVILLGGGLRARHHAFSLLTRQSPPSARQSARSPKTRPRSWPPARSRVSAKASEKHPA